MIPFFKLFNNCIDNFRNVPMCGGFFVPIADKNIQVFLYVHRFFFYKLYMIFISSKYLHRFGKFLPIFFVSFSVFCKSFFVFLQAFRNNSFPNRKLRYPFFRNYLSIGSLVDSENEVIILFSNKADLPSIACKLCRMFSMVPSNPDS